VVRATPADPYLSLNSKSRGHELKNALRQTHYSGTNSRRAPKSLSPAPSPAGVQGSPYSAVFSPAPAFPSRAPPLVFLPRSAHCSSPDLAANGGRPPPLSFPPPALGFSPSLPAPPRRNPRLCCPQFVAEDDGRPSCTTSIHD
jgi:hypothetical protein